MMVLEVTRPPVRVDTVASGNVTESAIRLFTRGYLGSLRCLGKEDGALIYTVPSETQNSVVYTIRYVPPEETLTCSCPAGKHAVPCKHVRLLQFQQGWVVEQ